MRGQPLAFGAFFSMITTMIFRRSGWYIAIIMLMGATAPAQAGTVNVSAADVSNHADASIEGSLQSALNKARVGDKVTLSDDALYVIHSRLDVPSGVILQGNRSELLHQKIVADPAFPADSAMIRMQGGASTSPTIIEDLWVDGAHHAWRIVELAPKGRYTKIKASRLEKTRSQFDTEDGGDYRSPVTGQPYYPLSLIEAQQVAHAEISNNILHFAGISETGKGNGANWSGIGYAIAATQSSALRISDNDIQFTLTGGIDITGSTNVQVVGNSLKWVARNVEWMNDAEGFLPPITAGIYGSHNQKLLFEHTGNALSKLQWAINDNTIAQSGAHGIHVGGNTIEIKNNIISDSAQVGLYAGDWRFDSYLPECTENVLITANKITTSGLYADGPTLWQKPASLPEWDKATFGTDIRIDHHYGNSVRAEQNQADSTYWENSPNRPWVFCGEKYEGLKPLNDVFITKRNEPVELADKLIGNDILKDASQARITHINSTPLTADTPVSLTFAKVELNSKGLPVLVLNPDYTGKFDFTYTLTSGDDTGEAKVYVKVE